jgi:DNA processing protein
MNSSGPGLGPSSDSNSVPTTGPLPGSALGPVPDRVPGLNDVESHAAVLAGLSGMTPVRLAKILEGFHPLLAWHALRAGTHPADPRRKFLASARDADAEEIARAYAENGIQVLLPDSDGYPATLMGDAGAPAVLFASGDPTVVEGRARVAIVGTRSATHYGLQMASELAGDLAAEGVVVVSGLAKGIDGAAHSGALRASAEETAPPVAVVGTGLDIVYPSSNRVLWGRVAEQGVIFSESALGTRAHPGVFPARNRIIAALSDVVVVVESHAGGGSLYTAEAAARRSIPVCAVPGSVRSPASMGTNALLVDGCTPVRDATDVLVAVSLARAERVTCPVAGRRSGTGTAESSPSSTVQTTSRMPLRATRAGKHSARLTHGLSSMTIRQQLVWEAVDDTPTAFETILIRTDLSIAAAAVACDELVASGALLAGAGWWSKQ